MAPFPNGLPQQKIGSLRYIYMVTDVQQTTCIIPSCIAQMDRSGTPLAIWQYSSHVIQNIKYILMLEDDLARIRKLLVDTVNRNQENRYHLSSAGIKQGDVEDVFENLCAEMGVTRQEVLKQSYRVGRILGDGKGQGKENGRKRKTETALYDDQQLPTDPEDEQRPDTARNDQRSTELSHEQRPIVTTRLRERRRVAAPREDQEAPEDEQGIVMAICEGKYCTASSDDEDSEIFTLRKLDNDQSRVTATCEDQPGPKTFLQDDRKSLVAGCPVPSSRDGRERGILGADGLGRGYGAKSLEERMADYNAAQKLKRRRGHDSNLETEGKLPDPVGKQSSSTARLGGQFLPVGTPRRAAGQERRYRCNG